MDCASVHRLVFVTCDPAFEAVSVSVSEAKPWQPKLFGVWLFILVQSSNIHRIFLYSQRDCLLSCDVDADLKKKKEKFLAVFVELSSLCSCKLPRCFLFVWYLSFTVFALHQFWDYVLKTPLLEQAHDWLESFMFHTDLTTSETYHPGSPVFVWEVNSEEVGLQLTLKKGGKYSHFCILRTWRVLCNSTLVFLISRNQVGQEGQKTMGLLLTLPRGLFSSCLSVCY